MGRPPLLTKLKDGEKLTLYLGVSQHALSTALIRAEQGVHHPVYYVSKSLVDAETRYANAKAGLLSENGIKKDATLFSSSSDRNPDQVLAEADLTKARHLGSPTKAIY